MKNDSQLEPDIYVERIIVCYQNLEDQIQQSGQSGMVDEAIGAAVGGGLAETAKNLFSDMVKDAETVNDDSQSSNVDHNNPTEVLSDNE